MAYNNNYNNRGYGNGNRSYGANGNNGYNNGYGQNSAPPKKHSGAKTKKYFPHSGPNKGVEQQLTSGWRLSNRELISFMCVTTQKSKLSEKGWLGSIACSVTNTKTGAKSFHWGTMEASTGKVVIDSMALVLNPKTNYCGTFVKPRR